MVWCLVDGIWSLHVIWPSGPWHGRWCVWRVPASEAPNAVPMLAGRLPGVDVDVASATVSVDSVEVEGSSTGGEEGPCEAETCDTHITHMTHTAHTETERQTDRHRERRTNQGQNEESQRRK